MEQRSFRTRSLGTKVTQAEFELLAGRARHEGQTLSEWARGVLLNEARSRRENFDLTCEVVGLQLLLINMLAPLVRGERVTAEQFQTTVRTVQTTKVKAAEEMLLRRHQGKEL